MSCVATDYKLMSSRWVWAQESGVIGVAGTFVLVVMIELFDCGMLSAMSACNIWKAWGKHWNRFQAAWSSMKGGLNADWFWLSLT
jgi:hypothetical protein